MDLLTTVIIDYMVAQVRKARIWRSFDPLTFVYYMQQYRSAIFLK